MKKIIRNPYFWICSIDWLLAQSHILAHDVYSKAQIFEMESGDVEYWVRDLSWKIRGVLWLTSLIVVPVLMMRTKFLPTTKQLVQLGVYVFVFSKDIYDWFTKTNYNYFNTGTFILDTVILI